MFSFFKNKIKKVYSQFTTKAVSIFTSQKLDENFLKDLYSLLVSSDAGIKTTEQIIERLKTDIQNKKINSLQEARQELERLLIDFLEKYSPKEIIDPKILLMVGVNGSGKTTFAGKFANKLKRQNKKVLLVAGDTFRAAATEQLKEWADKANTPIFAGKENQDPASVVFDACDKFKEEEFDHIIIDTAGRLQSKSNLMKELEKIKRIIDKQLPYEKIDVWLTIDSMLGQNSLNQAEIFHEVTRLDGLILTKLDGTGKGGIVFSITEKLKLPILYVTFGEGISDIAIFDINKYVKSLFEEY